jgi:hypothetical protein
MRSIFVLTFVVAAVAGLGRWASQEVVALLTGCAVIAVAVRTLWLPLEERSRVLAVLAAFYLPFFWLLPVSWPLGNTTGLLQWLPLAPAMVPTMFVMGLRAENFSHLMATLMIAECLVATSLARRSPMAAMVTMGLALATSGFGSFVLHALYRF